ncbi:MAG: Dabb family protein [Pirellulaceae bacterium]
MMRLPLVVAAGLLACLFSAAVADAAEPQLAHMVFFTLEKDTPANRQKLVDACNKYLSGHEGTVYYSAGEIADELKREVNDQEFDVALHLVFASKAAHDAYQTAPRHLKFIDENKQLWSKVRVFDSYVVPVSSSAAK